MAITREQALTAQEFHVRFPSDNRRNCTVWRRNGQTKLWKRSPERYEVPVKHGLYNYDTITEHVGSQDHIHTAEDCPDKAR